MSPPPLPYLPILAHIDPYWCFNMGYDKLTCQYLQYNMDKYVQIWQIKTSTLHLHFINIFININLNLNIFISLTSSLTSWMFICWPLKCPHIHIEMFASCTNPVRGIFITLPLWEPLGSVSIGTAWNGAMVPCRHLGQPPKNRRCWNHISLRVQKLGPFITNLPPPCFRGSRIIVVQNINHCTVTLHPTISLCFYPHHDSESENEDNLPIIHTNNSQGKP